MAISHLIENTYQQQIVMSVSSSILLRDCCAVYTTMVIQYNCFVVLGFERMLCDCLLLVYVLPVLQGVREDNGVCAGDVY